MPAWPESWTSTQTSASSFARCDAAACAACAACDSGSVTAPYLVLDIDGVLQAPSLSYGFEEMRVITERHATADVHPSLWPRRWTGYGADRRRKEYITFRTPVRVSPRLLGDLEALPAQIVMLTTWLENDSARAFLSQATDGRTWFQDAVHAQFFNWGYSLPATEENGFTELDSGIGGTPLLVDAAQVISPPIGLVGDIMSGLDHHNQIISGDISQNGVVLNTLGDIVGEVGR